MSIGFAHADERVCLESLILDGVNLTPLASLFFRNLANQSGCMAAGRPKSAWGVRDGKRLSPNFNDYGLLG